MRSRLTHVVLTTAALSCVLGAGLPDPAAAQQQSLSSRVRHAITGTTARHVDYEFAINGGGIVSHQPTSITAPASTEKLLTTVTLLQAAGADFRYATTVYSTGPIVDHTLQGDLVIHGSGDPSLTGNDLRRLAHTLHADGLHRVSGHVVVDASRYSTATRAPGWKESFVPEETGPVDAFTIDRNTWRRGKSFDSNPSYDNAVFWRNVLAKAHVHVRHHPQLRAASNLYRTLATHTSPTLGALVYQTLTFSDNFYAEMMLREAGRRYDGHGTRAAGIAAVRAEASALRVAVGTIHDGSGLSYADRESPGTLVHWLNAARSLTSYPTEFASLPVSCETGTLAYRLCGKHVAGAVHAKTGTLDGVETLAGWTTTVSGRAVTFAIMLSGTHDYAKAIKHLDAAVSTVIHHG